MSLRLTVGSIRVGLFQQKYSREQQFRGKIVVAAAYCKQWHPVSRDLATFKRKPCASIDETVKSFGSKIRASVQTETIHRGNARGVKPLELSITRREKWIRGKERSGRREVVNDERITST